MNLKEAREKIVPNVLDFGVVLDGTKLPYTIENTTGIPIIGYSKSCGCTGTCEFNETSLWGEVEAKYKVAKDKNKDMYLVDGVYCFLVPQTNGEKYLGVTTGAFVDNPQDIKKLSSYKFEQFITVRLKDDSPSEIQKEDGEVVSNPERLNIQVPVNFYVVK